MEYYVPVVIDGIDNPYDALVGILIFRDMPINTMKEVLAEIEDGYEVSRADSFEEYVLEEWEDIDFIAPAKFLTISDNL